ncbi:MAG TPA: energy transducer TonB [Alphaproteobacteria bacterium]|nr:energy transducer TonB [Alphaproteobacteria bacterium]
MLFKDWKRGESGGFLLLSLTLHLLFIASFCVWSLTHAVSAAEGPQIIEVALVVDNSLPSNAETSQAAAQKALPKPEKPKPVLREALKPAKKPPRIEKDEKPRQETAAKNNSLPASPVSSTAQAAAGSQNVDSYAATLLAWLNRHKRYPPQARADHTEGRALLWLAIEPDGAIADSRIEQSTGSPLLDEAIMHMVQSASPVPPPPGATSSRTFRLPVVFKLRP